MQSATRNSLRKLAHSRKPVVMIGRNGLNEQVTAAIDKALEDHELIKVKFLDHKDAKQEISGQLQELLHAETVSIIGNIVTLFRQNRDPDRRKVAIRID